jgi:hypothetical protein
LTRCVVILSRSSALWTALVVVGLAMLAAAALGVR